MRGKYRLCNIRTWVEWGQTLRLFGERMFADKARLSSNLIIHALTKDDQAQQKQPPAQHNK